MDKNPADGSSFRFSKFYQFDEITLYFLNLTLICLFLADPLIRSDFFDFVDFFAKTGEGILILLYGAYGFLTVFRLAVSSAKDNKYRGTAGMYAVAINLLIGASLVEHLDKKSGGPGEYIFPMFNLLLTLMLALALRWHMIKPEAIISDKQARGTELLVGTIYVPLLVFVSMILTHAHWTIIFDICMFYAVFLNRITLGLLPRVKKMVLKEKEA